MPDHPLVRTARWTFRVLMRAYPPSFRAEFGQDLRDAHDDRCAEEWRRGGWWGVTLYFLRAAPSTVRNGLAERVSTRRTQRAGLHLTDRMQQHLRGAFRGLVKQPRLVGLACLTLGLGVGANTAMFGIVRQVLLRPLPYHDPDRVLQVSATQNRRGMQSLSYADFADLSAMSESFVGMTAVRPWRMRVTGVGEPTVVETAGVAANFFEVLGSRPAVGRFFLAADEAADHDPVAVVSHGIWQREFGQDRGAIGRRLELNGAEYLIIGVAPRDFEDPFGHPAVYHLEPSWFDETRSRDDRDMLVLARSKPDVSLDAAQAEVDLIAERLAAAYPETNTDVGMRLTPLKERQVASARDAILILFTAATFVLLIACVNVANLFLIRAVERHRQLAIRVALGATRLHLLGDMVAEIAILSVVGGALGFSVAAFTTEALVSLGAATIPRGEGLQTDIVLFLFAWAVTGVALVLAGILPAVGTLRDSRTAPIGAGRQRVTPGGRSQSARSALVVAQIALSFVLLVGAGLLVRTLWNLQRIDPGIRAEHLLTFRVTPSSGGEGLTGLYQEVTAALTALPGVTSASAINILPLTGNQTAAIVSRGGQPATAGADGSHVAEIRSVTPEYFSTVGMTIVAGRELSPDDDEAHPPVAIVNETLARRIFGGEDPLGRHITVGDDPSWVATTRLVAGVVSDVAQVTLTGPPPPVVYIPHAQEVAPWRRHSMVVVLRTVADPVTYAASARDAVWRIDGAAPITELRSVPSIVAAQVSQPRLRAFVLVVFGVLAATLTGVGVLGVSTYAMTQRVREIGVRIALGAQRRDVVTLIVGQSARMTALGITLGVIAALALVRLLSRVLYGVAPMDFFTFGGVALLLTALSLAANYLPARRASRVDPANSLRLE